jgi:EpsI family protein
MAIVGRISQGVSSFSINNDAITWRARLSYCTLLLLWGYAFAPTLRSMLIALNQSDFNQHGIFAAILLMGLIYSKRSVFSRISPSVGQFGLVLLLLLSALWIFALIANIELLQQICVLALIPAMFILSFGYKISKALFFPLSYIFLLLPIGHIIIPNIQNWLLTNLVQIFAIFNFPVYWERQSIRTIYSVLDMTILSYGLNFSLVYLSIGFVYAYFITVAFWRRLIIAMLFVFGPIFFVFGGIYVLVCYESVLSSIAMDPNMLVYYSWGLISTGLFFSIICGLVLRQHEPYSDSLTRVDWQSSWRYSNFKWLRPTVIAAVIFAIVPLVVENIQHNTWISYKEIIYNHPVIPNWDGPIKISTSDWYPNFSTSTKSVLSGYKKANSIVKLFSAYYYTPMKSSSIMQAENVLYVKGEWKSIKVNHRMISSKFNKEFEVIETILSNGSKHIIMWHWYYLSDMTATNKIMIPLLDAIRVLLNKGDDVGVIAIATDVTDDVESDRQLLMQFLSDVEINLKQLMYPRKSF